MARIRTIKPDFFRHAALYRLERETGLPLRVAFAGLWTAADKAGRFRWRPDELKLDCLPYDEIDFSRVLDALESGGFIHRYQDGGDIFGHIPSWRLHQVINNRERPSSLPEPNEVNALPTRAPRDDNAKATRSHRVCGDTLMEGEGKGKGKGYSDASHPAPAAPSDPIDEIFLIGVPMLTGSGTSERNARSLLGKLRKDHGDLAVAAAVRRMAHERPAEPAAWITAALGKPAQRMQSQAKSASDWARELLPERQPHGTERDIDGTAERLD